MLDVSEYKQEILAFVDETGTDKRKALRTHGYSLCGDVKISQGTTNGSDFYDFVEKPLLPHLRTFDQTSSHSVVIMDNCSIHHTQEVVSLIEEVGVIVHFLLQT